MKKNLILIMLSIVLSVCFLCSCNNTKETKDGTKTEDTVKSKEFNEIKKNPTEEIVNSVSSSIESICSENAVLNTVIPTLQKGTVSVNFPYEETNVDVTIYNDSEARKDAILFASDAGTPIPNFGVYANKSELLIKCESLLGETAYGVDFETLYTDLSNWTVLGEFGVNFEEFDSEYGEQVKALFDFIANPPKSDEFNNEEYDKLVKKLDECVIKVDSVEIDAVKAVVVTYNLKTEDINEIVDVVFVQAKQYFSKFVPDFDKYSEEFTAEKIFENNGIKDFTVSLSVYLNEKNKDIMKAEANIKYIKTPYTNSQTGAMGPSPNEVPYKYSVTCDFEKGLKKTDKYEFVLLETKFAGTEDEESTIISATITESDSKDKLEYKMVITGGENTIESSLLINKENKTFEFTGNEDSDIKSISGTYSIDNQSLTVILDSIKVYDRVIEEIYEALDADKGVGAVEIIFKKDGKVEFPESYTKITDLTMDDLMTIFMGVANSPLLATSDLSL